MIDFIYMLIVFFSGGYFASAPLVALAIIIAPSLVGLLLVEIFMKSHNEPKSPQKIPVWFPFFFIGFFTIMMTLLFTTMSAMNRFASEGKECVQLYSEIDIPMYQVYCREKENIADEWLDFKFDSAYPNQQSHKLVDSLEN